MVSLKREQLYCVVCILVSLEYLEINTILVLKLFIFSIKCIISFNSWPELKILPSRIWEWIVLFFCLWESIHFNAQALLIFSKDTWSGVETAHPTPRALGRVSWGRPSSQPWQGIWLVVSSHLPVCLNIPSLPICITQGNREVGRSFLSFLSFLPH
jgi:hypothetical protein